MKSAVVAVAIACAACAHPPTSGPPVMRLGMDACDGCGMAVSDERYAAAIRGSIGGEARLLLFDDIGCLARWEAAHPEFTARERWVHDRETRRWIDVADAIFVRRADWSTPMGSGIAAFAAPDAPDVPNARMTWEQLLDAERQGGLDRPADGATEERR